MPTAQQRLVDAGVERPDLFPQFRIIQKKWASCGMGWALWCDCFNFSLCSHLASFPLPRGFMLTAPLNKLYEHKSPPRGALPGRTNQQQCLKPNVSMSWKNANLNILRLINFYKWSVLHLKCQQLIMIKKSMIPSELLFYDDFINVCWLMTLNPRETPGKQIRSIIPLLPTLFLYIRTKFIFLDHMLHLNIKKQ